MPASISCLLLAAGPSKRFGGAKQLAELKGWTLARMAMDAQLGSELGEVVVVLGSRSNAVRQALEDPRARFVVNPEYKKGLSSSMKVGLLALRSDAEGAVIALADQPLITPSLITRILKAHNRTRKEIVVVVREEVVIPRLLRKATLS